MSNSIEDIVCPVVEIFLHAPYTISKGIPLLSTDSPIPTPPPPLPY